MTASALKIVINPIQQLLIFVVYVNETGIATAHPRNRIKNRANMKIYSQAPATTPDAILITIKINQ